MNGPPPSKLVLLQDLYKQPLQSKVRFLGWYEIPSLWNPYYITERLKTIYLHAFSVSYYDTLSGRLLLEYPLSAAEAAEVAESRGLTTTKPTSTRTSSEIQKRKKTKGVRALDQEIRVATIAVDIGNILESIQRDDVQIGTWLNVLGYIRQESNSSDAESVCCPTLLIVDVEGKTWLMWIVEQRITWKCECGRGFRRWKSSQHLYWCGNCVSCTSDSNWWIR